MTPQMGGPTPAKTMHRSRPITRQLPAPITRPANPSPSPKGWKKLEPDRRVGLAIVVALERTSCETPPPSMIVSAAAAAAAAAAASSPISIASPRPAGRRACPEASESWLSGGGGGLLMVQETAAAAGELGRFQVADFLSFCHLCRRRLHGKDIYMYRGEKAFCSIECRCQQIISDEYQEICGAEAPRPAAEASSSPYSGDGRIFFPSIVVS